MPTTIEAPGRVRPAGGPAAPGPGGILSRAGGDLLRGWRRLVPVDLAFKALAFALLTPATALLLRWMVSGGEGVRADADLFRFFLETRAGVAALLVGGAALLAILALEMAGLMAVGLAAAEGRALGPPRALAFAASRAPQVLALTGHMVVRVLATLLPFAAAAGAAYALLLREHDINWYLAARPPAFWGAAAIVGVLATALLALSLRTVARWALALPLVLFEGIPPRRALGESARRTRGHARTVLLPLAGWAAVAGGLTALARWLPEVAGRALAPAFSGSLAALLTFVLALALAWGVLVLGVAVANAALASLVFVRLYREIGAPRALRVPEGGGGRLPPSVRIGVVAVAALAGAGVVLLALGSARRNQPVAVIAHRGASAVAPENTLAAVRLAIEQRTDYVEIDVQESRDGEVLVVHDSDLMKVGGSPLKIWEADAADLRRVDLRGERVPTLAEVLAACKGRSRVIIELKSYGHDQALEEKVVRLVEEAGMAGDCVFMSLDHGMVRRMKALRPAWTVGVLAAKAVGDLTALRADFLAVQASMATPRFVRRAHRAGQPVYVWTVDDPAWMLATMGRGVDGLITNRPDLARTVVERRGAMTDAQRVLVSLLVRLGARPEALATDDALRP